MSLEGQLLDQNSLRAFTGKMTDWNRVVEDQRTAPLTWLQTVFMRQSKASDQESGIAVRQPIPLPHASCLSHTKQTETGTAP